MHNYNGIAKTYDNDLYKATLPAEKKAKDICSRINFVFNNANQDGFKIDLGILNKSKTKKVAGLEIEVAVDSWKSHQFPYPTASILVKKEKYARLNYPAFFLRFNASLSNAYVVILDETTLRKEYIEKIKRRFDSRAVDGEERYALPKGLCSWGLENVEKYIYDKCKDFYKWK